MEKFITKTDKMKSLEKETNITLISTTVAIVSFFILLYSQNRIMTFYQRPDPVLTGIEAAYAIGAVVVAVLAIVKKQKWLWEYVIFGIITAIGYRLLQHGASGIPFITKDDLVFTPTEVALGKIITIKYVKFALWAVNVIYCVLAIVLHSVKYNKIKKIKISKNCKN